MKSVGKAMESFGYNRIARAEAIWSELNGHRKSVARRDGKAC